MEYPNDRLCYVYSRFYEELYRIFIKGHDGTATVYGFAEVNDKPTLIEGSTEQFTLPRDLDCYEEDIELLDDLVAAINLPEDCMYL